METALEYILTNSYKAEMISHIASHPDDFKEAINLAITDKQPYSWRAAWLLWSCMNDNDQRLTDYIRPIIESIPTKNDNQQRELFIILQKMKLIEEYEGILFDISIKVWQMINKKPSVRFNAFKTMVKIAQNHPDLSPEIIFLTQDQYLDSLSSCVKKSITKMILNLTPLRVIK